MATIALYALVNGLGLDADLYGLGLAGQVPLSIGAAGVTTTLALFLCTGMIYGAVKFLQEWASPLTVVNYFLLGTASGFSFATAHAALAAPALVPFYGGWAITLTVVALFTRAAALIRNARLKRISTLQTAIGVRHNHVQQRSMGMMGGAYNTREYFHGRSIAFLKSIKWIFLVLVFPLPVLLLWGGLAAESSALLILAFAVQYLGLLFERWFFFAQANHPQNLYYQVVG
jgi:DMSO reductase anchor subunit